MDESAMWTTPRHRTAETAWVDASEVVRVQNREKGMSTPLRCTSVAREHCGVAADGQQRARGFDLNGGRIIVTEICAAHRCRHDVRTKTKHQKKAGEGREGGMMVGGERERQGGLGCRQGGVSRGWHGQTRLARERGTDTTRVGRASRRSGRKGKVIIMRAPEAIVAVVVSLARTGGWT